MQSIETLMNEHRTIERAIDALVAFADGAIRGGDGRSELARFVAFIREFADAHHHGKEEEILFKGMVEAGFPEREGPIGVMLLEHDIGRRHVKSLADLSLAPAPWSDEERRQVHEEANGYAELLRGHIHKEDAILYPMARQRLPPRLQERVDAECAAFERRQAAEATRLQALAGELASRHGA